MKIVQFGIIGGGSIFSPELVNLIAKSMDKLGSVRIKLMDIDPTRQAVVGGLCERIVKKHGVPIAIEYVDTYEKAIQGSDYILIQFRVGGEDARIDDELLGKKYKIPFVETLTVCGIATFLRTYYELERIAALIQTLAPNAWVLNFANPAGLAAEALGRCGLQKVVGVCNASTRLLQAFKKKLSFTDQDNVYMNWRGLNHLTVVDSFLLNGEEKLPEILRTMGDFETDRMPFPGELYRKLGYLPNQYFQYYYMQRDIVEKEQKAEKVRSQLVKEINASLLRQYECIDYVPEDLTKRGGSGYSQTVMEVILSLHTGDNRIHYIVTKNNGAIPSLPQDCFVEVPCVVNKNRVLPIACPPLPQTADSLISAVKAHDLMLLEAAVERSRTKLYRSMILHPLIACHSVAAPLLEDILEHNRSYLPNEWFE